VLRIARGHLAPETTAALIRARELATETEDVTERLRMHLALIYQAVLRGETATVRELVERFRVDGENLQGSRAVGVADRIIGVACWLEGNYIDHERTSKRPSPRTVLSGTVPFPASKTYRPSR
jgi:hypothetical protein